MAREDHQPQEGPVQRPERGTEQMRAACGRTIAFVLAPDAQAEDIAATIRTAQRAQVAAAYVLAWPAAVGAAEEAVRGLRRKGSNVLVQALEYDPRAAVPMTRDAVDFELFGLPFGLLETMRALAEGSLDTYEAVLALDARMKAVTADHLYELCEDAAAHADADALASWVQWLRRPPYLVRRSFLEGLAQGPLTRRLEDGRRPVPRIAARDHLFGEEQLAAPARTPEKAEAFLAGCSMSALQAVALARYAAAHPGEQLHSPNQAPSLLGPVVPEPLTSADELLVQIAGEVLARDAQLPDDERAELAWADAFGARNRRDFPLLNDRAHAGRLAYLDTAATAQRVDVALQAQRDYDEHENANVYRGAYELSAQSTFTLNDARKALEDAIGAQRRETVLVANATAACNLVARAWGERNVGAGDTIVVPLAEHHSNMLPFAMLAERKGARVVHVPYGPDGRLDQRAYRAALADRPKLVAFAQVGNVFGIQEPAREMAAAAHAAGARVLVDAAQSFPHMKVDVRDLGADWVALSGHKAYGPFGIGALWVSPDAFAEMDPMGGGGGTVSHVSTESYYLRPKALQYELGTPPVSQAVGLAAAVGYLQALGWEDVRRHQAALTRQFVRGLSAIDGANALGDHSREDGQTGLVSFTVRSVAPADLAGFLGKLDVAIRAGGHCALPLHASLGLVGTGRVSTGVYTTADDIRAALVAIDACRRAYEA